MRIHLVLAGLSACLVAAVAAAETPDGSTPAEETICESLRGATPGLRGLCVAYCEAQDCDGPEAALAGECVPASRRLLELYERRRRAGDPPMPCVAPPPSECPCYSAGEIGALQLAFCYDDVESDGESLFAGNGSGDGGAGSAVWDGQPECLFIDPVTGEFRHLEIDAEEAAGCTHLLEGAIEANGLVCEESEGI